MHLRDEPDRDREQARLNRCPPRRVLEALPNIADVESHHASRAAHRQCRNQRTEQARDVVPDQGDDDDIRPRRNLCDREHVGELLVGHPAFHLDRQAMHLGDRGIGAADRKQRHQCEMAGKRQQRAGLVFHRRTQAIAMLSGISTASAA